MKQKLASKFIKKVPVHISANVTAEMPYVTFIQDMGTLTPVAQMYGRAIFDIKQEHTVAASPSGEQYYGVVWDNWVQRMAEYEERIHQIAQVIVNG